MENTLKAKAFRFFALFWRKVFHKYGKTPFYTELQLKSENAF